MMGHKEDISYGISVLRNEIDTIDSQLSNGHLLPNQLVELEKKRKSLQVTIYQLLKLN